MKVKHYFFCLFGIFLFQKVSAQLTAFEKDSAKNTTAQYSELISFYKALAEKYPHQCHLFTYGTTDVGKPLQLFVLSQDGTFDAKKLRLQNKSVLLINNGIHPGEPEGIDASMMLARDLLKQKRIPPKVAICIIPVYNIDGMLNRGVSRVNQNGPRSYGFRGNKQNLNLNRDFIKTESSNSYSFQKIFNIWNPDVLIDNHTSDGADYQYIMTLIETQKNKFNPILADYMHEKFTLQLYSRMGEKGYKLIPYVDFAGETPESGINEYLETPRYSTGYAALHNTIAYMPETHMWKPFKERVESTYDLMRFTINIMSEQGDTLVEKRAIANNYTAHQTTFPLQWTLDTTHYSVIPFYGYEPQHKLSEVSGYQRLFYDRSKPFTRDIKLYNHYQASLSVKAPSAYIIPGAYQKIINLLQINGVKMRRLTKDTTVSADFYYIGNFKTSNTLYEGHYIHSDVNINTQRLTMPFYEGDIIVPVNQITNRYIVETLEPQAMDSYFSWNFFDPILSQKEYFSDYIFEDYAAQYLKENPELRKELEKAKLENESLRNSARKQLEWVYQHSPYHEKTHNLYPIGRIM
ncbi:MAG: hypothetical protein DI598_00100 [Pseudopedobacter saltans]|uniref:Peptidase M14 domain-containing protein n=1 Tax=Pseudopedobacter saltans TaxID=151895 RepID=A0A2W5FG34_9SPHI|nr:MAG: hypothetical protein DI598_00100 [Pseudopedobacter saltans]